MISSENANEVLSQLINENPDLLDQLQPDLEEMAPEEGVEEFLAHKSEQIRPKTCTEYENKLSHFVEFCNMRGLNSLSDLKFKELNKYRHWRREESHSLDGSLSPKTMRDEMYLLKDFIRFLQKIDAVKSGLEEQIDPPTLTGDEGVRHIDIAEERVKAILDYLSDYKYASGEHVVWVFFDNTGRRPGGLHSLDVEDIHADSENPYIVLKHRPDETSLKNGKRGEQQVVITDRAAKVFKDYIEQNRIETKSENGRRPFLTSTKGRLSKSAIRRYIYKWSRPCEIGRKCPHDRHPDSCEAARNSDQASKCPSSRPPYALRHGYISRKLQQGLQVRTLSARCDVGEEVIEKHYDERTPEQRREFRRRQLNQLEEQPNKGGYL